MKTAPPGAGISRRQTQHSPSIPCYGPDKTRQSAPDASGTGSAAVARPGNRKRQRNRMTNPVNPDYICYFCRSKPEKTTAYPGMEKENNPIYAAATLEFTVVALEYCNFAEKGVAEGLFAFVDKAVKLLPLLYVKATLLPETDVEDEGMPEQTVTEEMYENVRIRIAGLLGEHDTFLETFHPDMPYSDAPIAAFVSECLADVYQDAGDFVAAFRQGNEEGMQAALTACRTNFRKYWGRQLLNALKALHAIRYDDEDNLERNDES